MRQADIQECKALGRTPKEALRLGLQMSLYALSAIEDDGGVTAMFGLTVVSGLEGLARPWLLGSDRVFMHGRELLCIGRHIIGLWKEEYPRLENIVSSDNERAIRLLGKWGFEIDQREEVHRGVAFRRFKLAQ